MKNRLTAAFLLAKTLLASIAMLASLPTASLAQVPVDENGQVIGDYQAQPSETATGDEDIPLLSTVDLEELVGPIALYPDDLLAIVLPAAAYPLQIVDAARFLEALENDPSLKPDPDWDDSVVALINYPEVVELLNEDIDWTWRLGEAVVAQQADVVAAIETFRDRAYAAGNLKSDSYQDVSRDNGVIEITPVAEDVIYVPYYEPERVVVYQPRPVYYYYPRSYPVYYYPYSAAHAFNHRYFWGVTTAFTIGWYSDSLHVFHHSYHGHPYYGHSYWDRWWYRRPSISIYNTNYVGSRTNVTVNRYYGGDRWRPRHNRRDYRSERRVTRNRHYPKTGATSATNRVQRINGERRTARNNTQRHQRAREPIAFRERPRTRAVNRGEATDRRQRTARVTPRDATTATRTRTRTDEAARPQDPQARDRMQRPRARRPDSRKRQSEPAPQRRRAEPAIQARRTEPVRQARRVETPQARRTEPVRQARRVETPQARRTEPVRQARRVETPQARRAEPSRQTRRANPAPQARRSETERQAVRAEPKRRQKAERKSAPAKEARRSSQRGSARRSQRRAEQ